MAAESEAVPLAGLWCREHESYCAHLAEAFGETHFEQLAQAVAERDVQLASELAGELGRRNADMLAALEKILGLTKPPWVAEAKEVLSYDVAQIAQRAIAKEKLA